MVLGPSWSPDHISFFFVPGYLGPGTWDKGQATKLVLGQEKFVPRYILCESVNTNLSVEVQIVQEPSLSQDNFFVAGPTSS